MRTRLIVATSVCNVAGAGAPTKGALCQLISGHRVDFVKLLARENPGASTITDDVAKCD